LLFEAVKKQDKAVLERELAEESVFLREHIEEKELFVRPKGLKAHP